MPCMVTTQQPACGQPAQPDCGCGSASGAHMPDVSGMPFNININNTPFTGTYAPHMEPVVNTPPVVVLSQQQQQQQGAPPQPTGYQGAMPVVGGGRDRTLIIEQPEIREHETEIIRREPTYIREETTRYTADDVPTRPITKRRFFKTHVAPTWY